MKVVLFAGGFGMRMRGYDGDSLPKPLQLVGDKPLIWHVMSYYASYGHDEFVICLGHAGDKIREALAEPGVCPATWDMQCVDTGEQTPIGERLRRVRHLLHPGEIFLANYSDVLTDAPLDDMIARVENDPRVLAQCMAVPPQSSFHVLEFCGAGRVSGIHAVSELPMRENGGYFVLRPGIFDYLPEGKDLITDACGEAARRGQMLAYEYCGFWKPADTFKERAELDERWARGDRPWARWEQPACVA